MTSNQSKNDRRSVRSGVPIGLLGALALIVAFEVWVDRLGLRVLNLEAAIWRQAGREAGARSLGADVLVIGDSHAQFGLIPSVIAGRSGLRVASLAILGGQAPAGSLLLRRALEAGAEPDLVILSLSPRLLELPPSHNGPLWGMMTSTSERLELAWISRDPGLFEVATLAAALPSFRGRALIRRAIAKRSTGIWRDNGLNGEVFLSNIRDNGGAIVARAEPFSFDLDHWVSNYYAEPWAPAPANDRYVRQLMDLTADRGIRVAWLITPVHPEIRDRCRANGFDAAFDRFLDGYRSRYPHLSIIDGRSADFEPGLFRDPHHLGRLGAIRLSNAVGELLRRPLGAIPDVAALPDAGPDLAEPAQAIRDVDQTRAALRDSYVRRLR